MFTLSICRHPTGKGFLALLQILLNFWVLKITDSIRFAYLVSGQPDKKKILDIRCICTNRFLEIRDCEVPVVISFEPWRDRYTGG